MRSALINFYYHHFLLDTEKINIHNSFLKIMQNSYNLSPKLFLSMVLNKNFTPTSAPDIQDSAKSRTTHPT
jgi:hypothetical protein